MAKPRVVPTGVLSSRPGIDSPAILAVVAEALGTDTALRDALDAANSFLIATDATGTETSLSEAYEPVRQVSGWRDLNSLHAEITADNILLVHRAGDQVTVSIDPSFSGGHGSVVGLRLPAGFRPMGGTGTPMGPLAITLISDESIPLGTLPISSDGTFATPRDFVGDTIFAACAGTVQFTTTEAWPDPLPGVATP